MPESSTEAASFTPGRPRGTGANSFAVAEPTRGTAEASAPAACPPGRRWPSRRPTSGSG